MRKIIIPSALALVFSTLHADPQPGANAYAANAIASCKQSDRRAKMGFDFKEATAVIGKRIGKGIYIRCNTEDSAKLYAALKEAKQEAVAQGDLVEAVTLTRIKTAQEVSVIYPDAQDKDAPFRTQCRSHRLVSAKGEVVAEPDCFIEQGFTL